MPLFAQQCSHSNICIPTKLLHFASLFLIFLVALQCPLHSSASFYYITTPSGNQLTAELLSNFRMPQQSAASMMPVRKNMLLGGFINSSCRVFSLWNIHIFIFALQVHRLEFEGINMKQLIRKQLQGVSLVKEALKSNEI